MGPSYRGTIRITRDASIYHATYHATVVPDLVKEQNKNELLHPTSTTTLPKTRLGYPPASLVPFSLHTASKKVHSAYPLPTPSTPAPRPLPFLPPGPLPPKNAPSPTPPYSPRPRSCPEMAKRTLVAPSLRGRLGEAARLLACRIRAARLPRRRRARAARPGRALSTSACRERTGSPRAVHV
jgi:hypothetical protein